MKREGSDEPVLSRRLVGVFSVRIFNKNPNHMALAHIKYVTDCASVKVSYIMVNDEHLCILPI